MRPCWFRNFSFDHAIEHYAIEANFAYDTSSGEAPLRPSIEYTDRLHLTIKLEVMADGGYFSNAKIPARDEAYITVTLPKPPTTGTTAADGGRFPDGIAPSQRRADAPPDRKRLPDAS